MYMRRAPQICRPEGEDLEGAAQGSKPQALTLRASCQGDASPWIPVFWGWGWGRALAPAPLPRWYFFRGRSPAYPFFRKEKIQLHRRRRNYPARRVELFSLRKKRTAGIRPSAWQKAGSLYRLNPQPLPPLKKPLKLRVPRGFNPLGRSARAEPSRPRPSTTQRV